MNKFTVLLSLYYKESPHYLRLSLDSVFSQTVLPTEVVLVEDGPLTEELHKVVGEYSRRYPELKIVALCQNQGLGKALNEGLKNCSYDIVARMDTDDIAKPNRFEKQLEVFENHPEYDVVGAWVDEFEDDIKRVCSVRKLPEHSDEIFEFSKKRNPMNHPVVMYKKNAVVKVGGYQHFPLFEDYYLWIRMLLNGSKFYNIQESLLYFRFTPDTFKRRGGFSYACTEANFLWYTHQLGMVSLGQVCMNILFRFGTRIVPNALRSFIYKKILR